MGTTQALLTQALFHPMAMSPAALSAGGGAAAATQAGPGEASTPRGAVLPQGRALGQWSWPLPHCLGPRAPLAQPCWDTKVALRPGPSLKEEGQEGSLNTSL